MKAIRAIIYASIFCIATPSVSQAKVNDDVKAASATLRANSVPTADLSFINNRVIAESWDAPNGGWSLEEANVLAAEMAGNKPLVKTRRWDSDGEFLVYLYSNKVEVWCALSPAGNIARLTAYREDWEPNVQYYKMLFNQWKGAYPEIPTSAEYGLIEEGMSETVALDLFNSNGRTELSRTESGDGECISYIWEYPDGSNIILVFDCGILISKSQNGLR